MKAVRFARHFHEEEHYWPSFTDVMSSLVFVLFFFIVIFSIKYIISAKAWDIQASETQASLNRNKELLESAKQDLERTNRELDEKKQEMAGLEKSLEDREEHINRLQEQLAEDQQALSSKEEELAELRRQLEEISVLRLSILKQVKASVEAELGSAFKAAGEPQVVIDNNANLVIQSSLLFAKGSSEISDSGRKMLRQFSVIFNKILSNPEIRENIDSIVVSGYADSDDTYQNNYFLSCERAIAVITAMMAENPALEKSYGRFFQASGFSEFRPLVKETNEASKAKNRRIQIAINIKDSHIQELLDEYSKRE